MVAVSSIRGHRNTHTSGPGNGASIETHDLDRGRSLDVFARGQEMKLPAHRQVIVTKHASSRAQQRGVVREAIYWTATCGTPERAAGGAVRRTLSNNATKRLARLGLPAAACCRYNGTVVITKDISPEERVVITVRPTEKSGKKRGAHHKPKYGIHKKKNTNGRCNQEKQ